MINTEKKIERRCFLVDIFVGLHFSVSVVVVHISSLLLITTLGTELAVAQKTSHLLHHLVCLRYPWENLSANLSPTFTHSLKFCALKDELWWLWIVKNLHFSPLSGRLETYLEIILAKRSPTEASTNLVKQQAIQIEWHLFDILCAIWYTCCHHTFSFEIYY